MSLINIFSIVALSLLGVLFLWSVIGMPILRKNVGKRKEEEMQRIVASFKEGDKILLASGIRGYFVKRKDDVLYVEIAKDVIIKVDTHGVIGIYK